MKTTILGILFALLIADSASAQPAEAVLLQYDELGEAEKQRVDQVIAARDAANAAYCKVLTEIYVAHDPVISAADLPDGFVDYVFDRCTVSANVDGIDLANDVHDRLAGSN